MLESFFAVLTPDLFGVVAISFVGGLMFGYTGWGAAMIIMPLLTFLYGPIEALAIVIFGAALVTAQLFPSAARKADWRSLRPLLAAVVIGVPIGSFMLFFFDPTLVRRVIGVFTIGASLLLMSGWLYSGPRGLVPGAIAGGVAGVISGFVGLGGPALVIYLLSSDEKAAVQRANILIVMTLIVIVIIVSLLVGGGITLQSIYRGLVSGPFQWAGGGVGAWAFAKVPSDIFKKLSLGALLILGLTVVIL